MKKRSLLFVALSLFLVSVLVLKTSDDEKRYTPRYSTNSLLDNEGASKLFHDMRANPETGEIDFAAYRLVENKEKAYRAEKAQDALGLVWQEVGPDNIGGRTRAILITQDDVMFTGSTTGGLFKSTNNGNTWERVISFDQGFAVSTIAQLGNGSIYVGTGHHSEVRAASHVGFGDGLFVSTDNGDTWDWAKDGDDNPIRPDDIGGGDYSLINKIVADPNDDNKLWVGSNEGLEPYVEGTGFLDSPDGLPNSGACQSISISGDGSVIAASMGSNNFYLSTDGGETFEDRAGNGDNEIPSNATRLEVAVSPDDANFIYGAIALGSPGSFGGVYGSSNGGETFELIWPGDVSSVNPDRPNSNSPIAWYALSIAVVPESPGLIVLGCLDVWIGGMNAQPEQKSFWQAMEFGSGSFPLDGTAYCHADVCTFTFDDNDDLYIGTDGGVFRSTDGANTFTSTNRFYNVTQFYGIGISGNDKVLGGSQDNGTNYITKTRSTVNEALKVSGGDGVLCDVSSLNPEGNVIFTSTPNNFVARSSDGGVLSMSPMITFDMANQPAPFRSVLKLWESGNATTPYIIDYINKTESDLLAGDEVDVQSRVFGYDFIATLENDLLPGDTAEISDIGTSLFAIGYSNTGGIYVTRDATYFDNFPTWAKIKSFVNGSVTTLEWSKNDGNYLWVGTSTGMIYRISGFANAWTVAELDHSSPDYALSIDSISTGNVYISDIAIDPNDEDHILYSRGSFGSTGKLMESTNATSSSPSFSNVWFSSSNPLAGLPIWTCLIEMNDPNTFIVGTEFGVYATDNGGDDWSPENTDPLNAVIIYDIRQQLMDPALVSNAGYIYLGTFGRGAFRSTNYEKNIFDESAGIQNEELVDDLVILPNPMREFGILSFNSSIDDNLEMEIYSVNGQNVKSIKFNVVEGENRIQFDVSDLNVGSYIIQLRNDTKVTTDKFVIVR